MTVDWMIVATIAGPVIAIPITIWLNRLYERRPKLISFIAHASAVNMVPPNNVPISIHSHSLIVRNLGNKAANNIKIGHHVLPDSFSIFPPRLFNRTILHDGSEEISFQSILPKEQVVVNYLYFSPLTFQNVTTYVKSDEQFATVKEVALSAKPSNFIILSASLLLIIGLITVIYGVVILILKLAKNL